MESPSRAFQSVVDSIPAHALSEITKRSGEKQEETRLPGRERELSFDWKSSRQEEEVLRSGSWKRDVSFNLLEKAIPIRERRVWQQRVLFSATGAAEEDALGASQPERFQGTVRT